MLAKRITSVNLLQLFHNNIDTVIAYDMNIWSEIHLLLCRDGYYILIEKCLFDVHVKYDDFDG